MSDYSIVRLANGAFSLRSASYAETFHPVIGPVGEAEALYVRQLKLRERIAASAEPFVVWDVGLGAAGNPVTLLRAAADIPRAVHIVSFDATEEPLRYALECGNALGYLSGLEENLRQVLDEGRAEFAVGQLRVLWEFRRGDFPAQMESAESLALPKPHAIFYDAFSPAKNPAMWTLPVFRNVFAHLSPARPCSMPTYSRSTLLRVTLLLAGFYVGAGHATGEKEETTVAANRMDLLDEPLGREWLMRARRSRSAEPLYLPHYAQMPLRDSTWEALQAHPQFRVA